MLPLTRCLALAFSGSLLFVSPAPAQTLERVQMQYPERVPQLLLSGTSPVYWDNVQATAQVEDQSISVLVFPPLIGFSVMSGWSVSVPLPVSRDAVYGITVSLASESGEPIEQIGFLRAWVYAPRRIFVSSFE